MNQQQRKKPALRLFHGAAGSPLSQTNEVATAAPLSNAERQKAFRERRREAKEAPERAALTNAILTKYRALDGIGERSTRKRAQEMRENHRRETEELATRLAEMTLAELRLFAAEHGETYQGVSDDKGRYLTDLETNPADKGNHDFKTLTGRYKIEDIVAVREHQEATLGSPQEYGSGQDMIGGRREVRPEGTSPDTDEGIKHNKNARSAKFDRKKFKVKLGTHQFDLIIADLVAEHFETIPETKTVVDSDGDFVSEGRAESFICRLCSAEVMWHRDQHRHMESDHDDVVEKRTKAEAVKGNKLAKAGKSAAALFKEHEEIRLRKQAKIENWSGKAVTP
jgi:hypothetical protein